MLAVLDSPLGELLHAAAEGRLGSVPAPRFRDAAAVTVVLASAGYPESSSKGDVITGVGVANGVNDVDVIHAGTALVHDETAATSWSPPVAGCSPSGRWATTSPTPASRAYAAADLISFDGLQRRSDIAAEPLGVVEGASLKEA